MLKEAYDENYEPTQQGFISRSLTFRANDGILIVLSFGLFLLRTFFFFVCFQVLDLHCNFFDDHHHKYLISLCDKDMELTMNALFLTIQKQ